MTTKVSFENIVTTNAREKKVCNFKFPWCEYLKVRRDRNIAMRSKMLEIHSPTIALDIQTWPLKCSFYRFHPLVKCSILKVDIYSFEWWFGALILCENQAKTINVDDELCALSLDSITQNFFGSKAFETKSDQKVRELNRLKWNWVWNSECGLDNDQTLTCWMWYKILFSAFERMILPFHWTPLKVSSSKGQSSYL